MLSCTMMYAVGIAALIATYGIGSTPARAADPPVRVTNTTANPVPTTINNPATNPVQAVITNSSSNLVNTKVWNTLNVLVGNSAAAPVKAQITNTADIPVLSKITNTAAAPVVAQITNTITNPVGVQISNHTLNVTDANNPSHAPFSKRLDIVFTNGSGDGSFTVPTGKRLVIKYISADVAVTPGAHVLFDLATYNQGAEVESHLPLIDQGVILGQQVSCMSEQTLIFADSGSTVTVAALASDSTGSGGTIVGIYGYLVSSTAASYE